MPNASTLLTGASILVSLLVTSGLVKFIISLAIRVAVLERVEQVQDHKMADLENDLIPRPEQEAHNEEVNRRLSRLEQ